MRKDVFDISRLPTEGFIRLSEVMEILPIGRTSFLKKVKEGTFPQPVKFSARIAAWRVSEIRALIEKFENGEV